jgi:membrane protein required for colicin V production
MIVIDLLISAYLIYQIYKGFLNGFISELSAILSILIALYAATNYYDYTLDFMQLFIKSNENDMTIFARVITFVLALMLVLIVSNSLTKMVDLAQMGLFNKISGAIFGFFKSLLIMSIFLNIFSKFNATILIVSPQHISESKLYYPIMQITHKIFPTFGGWYEHLIYEPNINREPQLLEDEKDKEDKKDRK